MKSAKYFGQEDEAVEDSRQRNGITSKVARWQAK